jgi:hypothetical protein
VPFSFAQNMGSIEEDSHPEAPWYEAAIVRGTASEIRGPRAEHVDWFAGLRVEGVSEGQHDGFPAVVLSLGQHGRVALTRDAEVDWIRDFHGEPEDGDGHDRMEAFLQRVWNKEAQPKVAAITLDLCHEDETVEEACAAISAAHGVSVVVVNPNGPGGGWPVVQVSGFLPNIRMALADVERGWAMDEDEISDFIV